MYRNPAPASARGLTLIELLVVLAIVAVIGALGTPGFRRQIAQAAVIGASNRTLAGLQLARRTALLTGATTTLCPTADRSRCGFGGREMMMFGNTGHGVDSVRESDEPLLEVWDLPQGVTLDGTRGFAAFLPRPGAATTLTFRFCHPADPRAQRAVVVSQTGRPRISRPADSSTALPTSCP